MNKTLATEGCWSLNFKENKIALIDEKGQELASAEFKSPKWSEDLSVVRRLVHARSLSLVLPVQQVELLNVQNVTTQAEAVAAVVKHLGGQEKDYVVRWHRTDTGTVIVAAAALTVVEAVQYARDWGFFPASVESPMIVPEFSGRVTFWPEKNQNPQQSDGLGLDAFPQSGCVSDVPPQDRALTQFLAASFAVLIGVGVVRGVSAHYFGAEDGKPAGYSAQIALEDVKKANDQTIQFADKASRLLKRKIHEMTALETLDALAQILPPDVSVQRVDLSGDQLQLSVAENMAAGVARALSASPVFDKVERQDGEDGSGIIRARRLPKENRL